LNHTPFRASGTRNRELLEDATMRGLTLRSVIVFAVTAILTSRLLAADHPLTAEMRSELTKQLNGTVKRFTEELNDNPRNINSYSRRGDAFFFLGKFKQAVADYEKMVDLNPKLGTSHWRRGIAYFYAGQYKKAAHQFEIYHTFDDVDRENGIWRFLSQSKAYGTKKAREGLLMYRKDDREPFPAVYKLFAGKTTPEAILKSIGLAKLPDDEREKRLFYAQLYIGLNYYVEQKLDLTRKHLCQAVANKWGQSASGGPNYMWHVGRVHYDLLTSSSR